MELMAQKTSANGEESVWLPVGELFPEIEFFFKKESYLNKLKCTYTDGSSITFKKGA